MQAKLEPGEYAFLLHSFDANWVIGADNKLLFSTDDTVKKSLLAEGFDALKDHEWLIPEGRKLRTHSGLALMVAITAAPTASIMVTLPTIDGNQKIVTYYQAVMKEQTTFVEQFRTTDGDYLLTQFDDIQEVYRRLHQALQIPVLIDKWKVPISLSIDNLKQIVECAQTSSADELAILLHAENVDSTMAQHISATMCQSIFIGEVEVACLNKNQPVWKDIMIYSADNASVWSMERVSNLSDFIIRPLNKNQFEQCIQDSIMCDFVSQ